MPIGHTSAGECFWVLCGVGGGVLLEVVEAPRDDFRRPTHRGQQEVAVTCVAQVGQLKANVGCDIKRNVTHVPPVMKSLARNRILPLKRERVTRVPDFNHYTKPSMYTLLYMLLKQ